MRELPLDKPRLNAQQTKKAEFQFIWKTRMHGDVTNAWGTYVTFISIGEFDELKPIENYEAYFRRKDAEYKVIEEQEFADHIMYISDPEKVARYDALVAKVNADLPSIKREKDKEGFMAVFREMWLLVKGEDYAPQKV